MKHKKIIIAAIAVVVLCVAACVVYATTTIRIDQDRYYQVASVMDGDTFKAKVGLHTITVRMLGIDTPETVDPRKPEQCYGREASDMTKKLLVGKSVRLELNPDREEKDKYGRYLAYVYLGDDTFMNEYLLKNGFAREYTYGKPYMYQEEFRGMEKDAREKRMGLWGACGDLNPKLLKL